MCLTTSVLLSDLSMADCVPNVNIASEYASASAFPISAIKSIMPVAPFVRITDRGVVDTLTQEFIAIGGGDTD
jgi:hypothetical protein